VYLKISRKLCNYKAVGAHPNLSFGMGGLKSLNLDIKVKCYKNHFSHNMLCLSMLFSYDDRRIVNNINSSKWSICTTHPDLVYCQ